MAAKGLNTELRKKNNRNKILNIIRSYEDTSRYDIKKMSKLSMTTVLTTIDELLKEGLIIEAGIGESKGGRKPIWLEINPKGGYFLGVEFNTEYIHSIVLDFSGEVIYSNKVQIDAETETPQSIIAIIKSTIKDMIDYLKDSKDKIFGIGIGAPGYVDIKSGVSLEYAHIKGWQNVPIKREIEKEFNIPTFVENNVNAMALAYKWLEFDGSCSNILFVSIRRGIRMSCILNNDLYRGKDNTAGEIGHLRVQSGNRLCSCGKKGCLETEASNSGIRAKLLEGIEKNRYKELLELVGGDLQKVNIYSFVQSCLCGHQDSLELLDEVAEYIGDALSKVVILLNPDMIVISGEITKCGDIFLNKIREYISKNAIDVDAKGLNIERSKFGDNIGGIGAASIVMQEEFRFS